MQDHEIAAATRQSKGILSLDVLAWDVRVQDPTLEPTRPIGKTTDNGACWSPAEVCYLTSFSKARRRWSCDFGSSDPSAVPSSGTIASHRAFNSESAT